MFIQLTGRQWRTLVVLCTSNACVYAANNLLPPFYPGLAEDKGVTALQYGFVLGIFRLVMAIISPVYGRYIIGTIGLRFMLTAGLIIAAGSSALMGVLNNVHGTEAFLGLSFLIQILAALGSATLPNAITLLVNKEFPDSVGSAFGLTETATGVGCIASPLIGGLLYQAAGYTAPFAAAGCVLVLAAFMALLVLPQEKKHEEYLEQKCNGVVPAIFQQKPSVSAADVLLQPTLLLFLLCNLMGAFTKAFLLCGLDQHLRPLQLTPLHTGLVFVMSSSIYTISVPVWGHLCDKLSHRPVIVPLICTSLVCITMFWLGPAPFIPLELNLPTFLVVIAIMRTADSGQIVGSFSGLFRAAEGCGLPKGPATHEVLGGCINATYNLGCFLGFSCAGIFLETLGYRWSTMVIVFLQLTLLIVTSLYYLCKKNHKEYQPLVQENNNVKCLNKSYGAIEPVFIESA